MPKLYYPNADELQGAPPLDERLWFKRYQSVLLRLVNTNEGRDLLCIDSLQLPIIAIEKNRVCYNVGKTGDNSTTYISDVRVGAKWGNVIRSRWRDIAPTLSRMAFEEMMAWPTLGGPQRLAIARCANTTVYPDPHPESTTVDGRVGRNVSQEAWSSIQGGAGTEAADSIGTGDHMAYFQSGGSSWEAIRRSIILFDARGIGDADALDSAVLSIYGAAESDALGISPALNIYASTPNSTTALQNDDYADLGATDLSSDKNLAAWDADGYNDFTLNANGEAAVKFDDITKLGARESVYDAPNSEPSHSGNSNIAFAGWFAEKGGTGQDPKLVIVHTSPFTPKAIMF